MTRDDSDSHRDGGQGAPRLSCITTCFNEGALLAVSIRSLLAQDFTDFELIVLSDGADAETRAVAEGFDDPRIRVIRQANDGLSSARNRALALARGDYVCFLDADDSRPTWALRQIAEQLAAETPDVLITPGYLSETIDRLSPFYDTPVLRELSAHLADGPATPDDPARMTRARWLAQLAEPQSANKIVRRQFLRDHGLGFPNTHYFEDIHFHTMVLARAGRISVGTSPAFTYYRRHARAQVTGSSDALRFDALAVMRMTLDRFAAEPGFADPLYRAAVLLSCAKLVRWSGDVISHHHRSAYRHGVLAMLAVVDRGWLEMPRGLPAPFDGMRWTRKWLRPLQKSRMLRPARTGLLRREVSQ